MNVWIDARCVMCGRRFKLALDSRHLLPGVPLVHYGSCPKCTTDLTVERIEDESEDTHEMPDDA